MARLELKGIRKSFGPVEVLHGLDLTVVDGSFTVFVGPSGCGKSTLLRMIAGLDAVSAGAIAIDGRRCDHLLPSARGMAMVFQSYALYPHMSVHENLRFGLVCQKTPKAEIEPRIRRAAEILRIDHLLQRKPAQLSGGQSQRVAIGRAIVKEPKVFLFDEPLSNLDAELRVTMRGEIVALHQRLGTTMIYVTHDQVEAMTMADTIVVLRDGRIEQVGSPVDLYMRPCNRFVAGFIGSPQMSMLAGTVVAGDGGMAVAVDEARAALRVDRREPPGGIGSPCTIGLRPEHLQPDDEGPLAITLATREFVGADTIVSGTLASGERMTASLRGFHAAAAGSVQRFRIDPHDIHIFAADGIALARTDDEQPADPPRPAPIPSAPMRQPPAAEVARAER